MTVRVGVTAETEQAGQLQYRRDELYRMYKEAVDVHEDRRKEVNALMAKRKCAQ